MHRADGIMVDVDCGLKFLVRNVDDGKRELDAVNEERLHLPLLNARHSPQARNFSTPTPNFPPLNEGLPPRPPLPFHNSHPPAAPQCASRPW